MFRLSNLKIDRSGGVGAHPLAGILRHPAATHPVTLIVVAALFLSLPALVFGFPNGHDTKFHLVWHTSFAAQFWNGELYPRWLRDVAWGHGGPVFFFYPPVGFYASALAAKLVAVDPLGRHALSIAAVAALALSGATTYLWLRTMAGRGAAISSAVLYMAIPYHLGVDLYLRASYGEFWGFVWMPLVLYFVRRSVDWPVAAPVGLAASYCGLIMSHMPTTLLFSPLAGAYLLFLYARNKTILLRCVLGLAAGVLLSSVYLLPAMLYQDLVVAQQYWKEVLYAFSPTNFMEKLAPVSGEMDVALLAFVVVLHCSFLHVAYVIRTCWFARSIVAADDRRQLVFWLWACAAIFFFSTPLSAFIWDILPVFKKVQFAWRLHTVLCVAVLPVWAYAVEAARALDGRRRRGVILSFGFVIAAALAIDFAATGNAARFDSAEAKVRASEAAGLVHLMLPKSAAGLLTDSVDLDSDLRSRFSAGRPETWLVDGEAAVRVLDWAPRRISLRVDASRPSRLAVRQLYFAGWKARKDGGCCLAVSPHPTEAVVTVEAPQGVYRLDLVLTKGRVEHLGEWLSAAALLMLFGWGVFGRLRRRRF